jgi:EGF-like domain/Human growth factor-like EGF
MFLFVVAVVEFRSITATSPPPTTYIPPTLKPTPALNYAFTAGAPGTSSPSWVGILGGSAVTIDDDGFTYAAFETLNSFSIGNVNFDSFDYTVDGATNFARTQLVKLSADGGTALLGAESYSPGQSDLRDFKINSMQAINGRLYVSGSFDDLAPYWKGDDGVHNITFHRQETDTMAGWDGFLMSVNPSTLRASWGIVISSNSSTITNTQFHALALHATPSAVGDFVYIVGNWVTASSVYPNPLTVREESYTSTVDHTNVCTPTSPQTNANPYLLQIIASTGRYQAALCTTASDHITMFTGMTVDTLGQIYVSGDMTSTAVSWVGISGNTITVINTVGSGQYGGFIIAVSQTVFDTNRLRVKWALPIIEDVGMNVFHIALDLQSNIVLFTAPFATETDTVVVLDRTVTTAMCGNRATTDGTNMYDLSHGYNAFNGPIFVSIANTANSSVAPTMCQWMTHYCAAGMGAGNHALTVDPVTGFVYILHDTQLKEWSTIATGNSNGTFNTTTGCCGGPSEGANSLSFARLDPVTGLPQFSYGFDTIASGGQLFPAHQPIAVHPSKGGQIVVVGFQYNFDNVATTIPFYDTRYAPYWPAWDAKYGSNSAVLPAISDWPAGGQYLLVIAANDYCARSPCQNGGTCDNVAQTGNGYRCTCATGYSGVNCQTDINECASLPCQNGGTCVDSLNSFSCLCVPGYCGLICQTNINECSSVPCANGGSCVDGINSYFCIQPFIPSQTARHPPALNYVLTAGAPGIDQSLIVGNNGGGAVTIDENGFTYAAIESFKSFPIGNVTFDDFDYTVLSSPGFGFSRTLMVKLSATGTPLIGANSIPSPDGQFNFIPFNLHSKNSMLFMSGFFTGLAHSWVGDDGFHNITFHHFEQQFSGNFDGFVMGLNSTTLHALWGIVLSLNVSIDEPQILPQSLDVAPCLVGDHIYTVGWWLSFTSESNTLDIREESSTSTVAHSTCSLPPGGLGNGQPFLVQIAASIGQFKAALCNTVSDGATFFTDVVVDALGQIYVSGRTSSSPVSWDGETDGSSISIYADLSSVYTGFVLAVSPVVYSGKRLRVKWALPFVSDHWVFVPQLTLDLQSNIIIIATFFSSDSTDSTYVTIADRTFTPNMCGFRPSTDGSNMADLSNGQYTHLSGPIVANIVNTANSSAAPSKCNWISHFCAAGDGQTNGLVVDPITGLIYVATNTGQTEWSTIATTNSDGVSTTVTGCCGGPSEGQYSVSFNRLDPATGLPQISYGFATSDFPNGAIYLGHQSVALNPITGGGQLVMITTQYNNQDGPLTSIPFYNTTYAPYWGAWDGNPQDNSVLLPSVPANNEYLLLISANDECVQSPCQHGGTCTNTPRTANGFTCVCPSAYTGASCQLDALACLSLPCMNGGTCQPMGVGFSCLCIPGYSGLLCQTTVNNCDSQPCTNGHGSCSPFLNGYTCSCVAGYSGLLCETDINECVSDPCRNGATCRDGVNDYECLCLSGYAGTFCETDINECSSNPCTTGQGTCIDQLNAFYCHCNGGYSGVYCQTDINECASNPCQNSGTCKDGVNSWYCQCSSGFSGVSCQTDINECASNPCRNGATCVDWINHFECRCVAGYSGTLCETDMNECASQPCQHVGSICIDLVNHFICNCASGYSGILCQTDINECASQPCQNGGSCMDWINRWTCSCSSGFSGSQCQTDINECSSLPCSSGPGTVACLDGINQYQCQCVAGFAGVFCETEINECSSLPCLNNGNCTDLVNSFVCNCTFPFFGETCENQTLFLSETIEQSSLSSSSSSSTAIAIQTNNIPISQSTPLQSLKDLTSGPSVTTLAITAVVTLLPILSTVQTITTALPALSSAAASAAVSAVAAGGTVPLSTIVSAAPAAAPAFPYI